jgi:hypothetical protein
MLAADQSGSERLRFHGKYGISGVIGGGSTRERCRRAAHGRLQAAYARRGVKLELGRRLALGYQFTSRLAASRRSRPPRIAENDEDVRRAALLGADR